MIYFECFYNLIEIKHLFQFLIKNQIYPTSTSTIYAHSFTFDNFLLRYELHDDNLIKENEYTAKFWNSNGNLMKETYQINGKFHRTNGPAVIFYLPNGQIENEFYFVNGIEKAKL